jgi:hypothetical protein
MRTTLQEAERTIDKVIGNLQEACAIASGQQKGSLSKLCHRVGLARNWCNELLTFAHNVETWEEISDKEKEWASSKQWIAQLLDDLSRISKIFDGEIECSLGNVEELLDESFRVATRLKQVILGESK